MCTGDGVEVADVKKRRGVMSSTPETVVTPIRLLINQVIEYGQRLLAQGQIPIGRAQMHTRRAKHVLGKIFGEQGPHVLLFADPQIGTDANIFVAQRNAFLEAVASRLDASLRPMEVIGKHVFFGHGHSPLWRELKDFVAGRLGLPWDEFNRESVAGPRRQSVCSQC